MLNRVRMAICLMVAVLMVSSHVSGQVAGFEDLTRRLAETKAMGIFSKLSIKANAARLHEALRRYHDGERRSTLDELRERYHVLLQEIVALVQRKDPDLARAVSAARGPLWAALADAESFAAGL